MSGAKLDWVRVPAGPFTMGSEPAAAPAPDADESPRHEVAVDAFRIARTPVTNAQYAAFVEDTGSLAPCHWPGDAPAAGTERQPVTYVTWEEAASFCAWAGGALPTEAQWERAARGDDERTWPWGDEQPDALRCTHDCFDGPPPVGVTPAGASPFGVLDLAGTVWEWTSSAYRPYPYDARDGRERAAPDERRVVRGGSFVHPAHDVRCAARHPLPAGVRDHYVGLRAAAAPGAGAPLLDWVGIPAGRVVLGTDGAPSAGGHGHPSETPAHALELDAFELGRVPVTNAQFAAYAAETGAPAPLHWPDGRLPAALAEHPVAYVDWHEASAFCAWAGGRLPTEAEWEKAARGDDGRAFPWGDLPDESRAAVGRGAKHGATTPVGAHPSGASPYGLLDMAGNVWEWVSTAHRAYPYRPDDGREDPAAHEPRVLRGGSFASDGVDALRCTRRSRSWPCRRQGHIGFRVAREAGRGA